MRSNRFAGSHVARRAALVLWAAGLVVVLPQTLLAQQQAQVSSISTRAVGGVAIDPSGMMTALTETQRAELRQEIVRLIQATPEGMQAKSQLRKVSLGRLEAALRQQAAGAKPLDDAIQCLGGLQRVQYVLVYPEQHDIVLAGPGEGWKVGQHGGLVGVTTDRPVLLLDDFVVALRAVASPKPSVISCSINPSQEGLKRYQSYVRQLRAGANPAQAAMGIEQQLGPQVISVTGVPGTSHFANVMVAADYRMKRIGMGFEQSPVRGLPSFFKTASARGAANMMPRWWLEPEYETLASDPDGLAWEIRGSRVKTLTEADYLRAGGAREHSGKADPASQKWADLMTASYDQLALAEPIFGQLHNCMDLAVVAALIVTKNLPAKAGCELPMLMGGVSTAELPAPKQVASKAYVIPRGRQFMIPCGGVQINPWAVVEKAQQSGSLASVRGQATMKDSANWWAD